ncbi:MAG: ABC transporter substrate-binding protein [Treponema sp.]|nr:ABC transporter substrate-binding protein [Treponema sp.]
MKKTTFLAVLLVAAIAMVFVSCGGGDRGGVTAEGYRDTMVVVIHMEPVTMYPPEQPDPGSVIVRLIYSQLVTRSSCNEYKVVPEVAYRWEHLNDTTIRFFLVDNVYFSNGENLTAYDVQFSLMNANANPFVQIFGSIERVEVVGPHIVDVYLTGANAAFMANLSFTRASAILNKRHAQAVGREGLIRNPLGSGPYVLERWTSGQEIVLARRDCYPGVGPHAPQGGTERIIFRFIPEASSRSMALETGEADIVINPDLNDLDRLASLGFVVETNLSWMISQVNINAAGIPDIRIREALAWAIDREALVEAVFGDMATVATSFVTPYMLGHYNNWNVYYNPDRARQLVAQSNTPGGTTLDMIVWNLPENLMVAEILQFYWRQVGIDVNVLPGATGPVRDQFFAGTYQIYPTNHTWGEINRALHSYVLRPTTYNLPEPYLSRVSDLWHRGLEEMNEARRIELYREMMQVIKSQWVTIPLAFRNIAYVTTNRVDGFFASPGQQPNLMGVRVRN